MANLDLSKYGITGVTEILHNPSYDVLFAEETKPSLEGFEKGQVTELGAVNVMTGRKLYLPVPFQKTNCLHSVPDVNSILHTRLLSASSHRQEKRDCTLQSRKNSPKSPDTVLSQKLLMVPFYAETIN